MARKNRQPTAGGTWHVMARGNRGQFIFERPADNRYFLNLLGDTIKLYGWQCLGYCLMSNHYHLIIDTPTPNLSRGMRHLNGRFAQYSNHVHDNYGHLFHDRFHCEQVDSDAYLFTLLRYLALNPVRAEIVDHPADWPWSSWHDVLELKTAPTKWFNDRAVLERFGPNLDVARLSYQRLVLSSLSDAAADHDLEEISDRVKVQRKRARPTASSTGRKIGRPDRAGAIEDCLTNCDGRDENILAAWTTGHYSYTEIARALNIHRSTVSRVVQRELSK